MFLTCFSAFPMFGVYERRLYGETRVIAEFRLHSIARGLQRAALDGRFDVEKEIRHALPAMWLLDASCRELTLCNAFAPTSHGIFVGEVGRGAHPYDRMVCVFHTYLGRQSLSPRWDALDRLFTDTIPAEIRSDWRRFADAYVAQDGKLETALRGEVSALVERLRERRFAWLSEPYEPRIDGGAAAWADAPSRRAPEHTEQ